MDADVTARGNIYDPRDLRQRASVEVTAAMGRWAQSEMVWGTDDCMLAVADVVKAVTGKDPARRFRGRYRSKLAALRLLGRGGIDKAARDSARALHWRRIGDSAARPGDVGLITLMMIAADGKAKPVRVPMVCRAPGWFVGRNARGFIARPAAQLDVIWAIA